jgi:ankyrin repeat protein
VYTLQIEMNSLTDRSDDLSKRTGNREHKVITVIVLLLLCFAIILARKGSKRMAASTDKDNKLVTEFLNSCALGSEHVLKTLDQQPLLLNKSDDAGWTCLINASKNGRLPLVKALLLRGASTGGPVMKHSALRGAAIFGHNDVVTALIQANALVDVFSDHNRTPLMGAAMNGHKSVVETLLRAGANPAIKNDNGETAADLAKQNGHSEIYQLIRNANNVID